MVVRAVRAEERGRVREFVVERWGDARVVGHGTVYYPEVLPGFVTEVDGKWVGLVTYTVEGDACEIVTIDSLEEGRGVGTALIDAVAEEARGARCRRLWLITTNDNLNALRFYQRRGFALVAVHRDAVTRSRVIKPAIPLVGMHGIPLRDEIELEMNLEG